MCMDACAYHVRMCVGRDWEATQVCMEVCRTCMHANRYGQRSMHVWCVHGTNLARLISSTGVWSVRYSVINGSKRNGLSTPDTPCYPSPHNAHHTEDRQMDENDRETTSRQRKRKTNSSAHFQDDRDDELQCESCGGRRGHSKRE